MPIGLTMSPSLLSVVRLGALWLDGAVVVGREARLDEPLVRAEAAVRADPPGGVASVRTMYKRVGLDPTKTRPSAEALLRRVRKGGSLPRINSMVDVCNWCSLECQLPFGLYDAARFEGDAVELRPGLEGESYRGIRKDVVHVGGRITLADARGAFGNPTSDSSRTMVTVATTRALLVVFAPMDTPTSILGRVLDTTAVRMGAFVGATATRVMVGGA